MRSFASSSLLLHFVQDFLLLPSPIIGQLYLSQLILAISWLSARIGAFRSTIACSEVMLRELYFSHQVAPLSTGGRTSSFATSFVSSSAAFTSSWPQFRIIQPATPASV